MENFEKTFYPDQWSYNWGPASASVTDIFGAVFIDPVAKEGVSFIPGDWKRYRNDTWDIEENVNEKDLVRFTEYMNAKVLKDKIKFTLEHIETELVFLDTKVHLKNGFLIPEMYSNNRLA